MAGRRGLVRGLQAWGRTSGLQRTGVCPPEALGAQVSRCRRRRRSRRAPLCSSVDGVQQQPAYGASARCTPTCLCQFPACAAGRGRRRRPRAALRRGAAGAHGRRGRAPLRRQRAGKVSRGGAQGAVRCLHVSQRSQGSGGQRVARARRHLPPPAHLGTAASQRGAGVGWGGHAAVGKRAAVGEAGMPVVLLLASASSNAARLPACAFGET